MEIHEKLTCIAVVPDYQNGLCRFFYLTPFNSLLLIVVTFNNCLCVTGLSAVMLADEYTDLDTIIIIKYSNAIKSLISRLQWRSDNCSIDTYYTKIIF